MSTRLLILERREDRFSEIRAMNAIRAAGGKIRHRAGRIFLLDTLERDAEISRALPEGSRLVPADSDVSTTLTDLDQSEYLLLEAVKVINSPSYRTAKQRYRPGETPQERQIFAGPDVEG